VAWQLILLLFKKYWAISFPNHLVTLPLDFGKMRRVFYHHVDATGLVVKETGFPSFTFSLSLSFSFSVPLSSSHSPPNLLDFSIIILSFSHLFMEFLSLSLSLCLYLSFSLLFLY
jgi:hypothetical protein